MRELWRWEVVPWLLRTSCRMGLHFKEYWPNLGMRACTCRGLAASKLAGEGRPNGDD